MTWNKPSEGNRSLTVRFGLLTLLLIREISYYLVTQFTLLIVTFVILRFPTDPTALAQLIFFQYPVSAWFFIIRSVPEARRQWPPVNTTLTDTAASFV